MDYGLPNRDCEIVCANFIGTIGILRYAQDDKSRTVVKERKHVIGLELVATVEKIQFHRKT